MKTEELTAQIWVDLNATPHLVGVLRAIAARAGDRASFEYESSWLTNPERFALEPALRLGKGAFYPDGDRKLLGAFSDSAPDRWGRILMQRAERERAQAAGTKPRALREWDYLLGVNDETRIGALRFSAPTGGPFLATGGTPVPPLVDLPRLAAAANRVDIDDPSNADLALLLAPGSSLGGARPKANVRLEGDQLAIAKFTRASDEWPVVRWEAVAMSLAERAGIRVPIHEVQDLAGSHALISQRFDRNGANRIPYLSALSMLGASDGEEGHSYPEIAEAIRQHGAMPTEDLKELFRRMIFGIFINNTDDHLRNHAFLWLSNAGWTLAPAFDLNPTPRDIQGAVHSIGITSDGNTIARLEPALTELEYFDLSLKEAKEIAAAIAKTVAKWREMAGALGMTKSDCDRLASAFEHEDLALALKWATSA